MFYILKRAMDKAKRDGVFTLARQSFPWLINFFASKFNAQKNSMQANWFLHIKEMDHREITLKSTPWVLNIESTGQCNLRCIMCPHFFSGNEGCTNLSVEDISSLKPFIERAGEFQLHGGGEPLVSQSFWKILDIIEESHISKVQISINSNGVLLTDKNRQRLLDSPLSQVSFSIDAATPLTYSRVRGADFGKTIENIGAFIRKRNARNKVKPTVHINMLLMKDSIEEAVEFVRLGQRLGVDAVEFWPLHNVDECISSDWTAQRDGWTFVYQDQLLDKADPTIVNEACNAADKLGKELGVSVLWPLGKPCFSIPSTSSQFGSFNVTSQKVEEKPASQANFDSKFDIFNCKTPWEWMFIDLHGNIRPCCFVSKVFGNLHDNTPEEIWNNEEYKELRRKISQNVIPDCCKNAACPYVRERSYHA